ncbi:hypothetical protein Snoj_37050 [Streptomyces nojiriensis]|uniref:Uncharacterized protein n=1 Tax=Streptomyces nojiriensis TaxID=66374 RepID=A0ABQ3SP17_9ACTN|nr:hypothetical protein [Streptomyces nojiriensis]QTI43336.1 hypothetical protein JYK04_01098 [Streptomyces nojiriensis]GGS12187.1 hypothetical protein GCM10010205_47420 [Streptomyces nojiriensis]GHI69787.1 hypothetical protein Snoj_37050 [Streptomyces nojiriensis]
MVTGHRPLLCRGCAGNLYAVCTMDHAGGKAGRDPVGQWEVDHETPVPCPLSALLPLTGTAASVHDLPGAEEVLGPPV